MLSLSFNKFYDIYDECLTDEFWNMDPSYRFSRINMVFAIYAELLQYEPIKRVIEEVKKTHPPMEGIIGSELFKFIRNIFAHFPFFDSWNEVYINKRLVNWYKDGLSLDRFLSRYSGKEQVKYRMWDAKKRQMIYVTFSFPNTYDDKDIYLKDILPEREGAMFCLALMRRIMDTQVVME